MESKADMIDTLISKIQGSGKIVASKPKPKKKTHKVKQEYFQPKKTIEKKIALEIEKVLEKMKPKTTTTSAPKQKSIKLKKVKIEPRPTLGDIPELEPISKDDEKEILKDVVRKLTYDDEDEVPLASRFGKKMAEINMTKTHHKKGKSSTKKNKGKKTSGLGIVLPQIQWNGSGILAQPPMKYFYKK